MGQLIAAELVRRAKLDGNFGWHYGLLLEVAGQPDSVVHRDELKLKHEVYDTFAAGRDVYVVQRLTAPGALASVSARLADLRRGTCSYDVATCNCEHLARWLATGRMESTQVAGVVVGVALLTLLVLLLAE